MKEKTILIIPIIFIVLILLVYLIPNSNKDYVISKVYINEIMASNYSTLKNNYGEYTDYIEIYNSTNSKIDLSGYYLSDSEFKTDKWQFKETYIEAKNYLIVFADGMDECINNICHTNFKLSSKGEVVTLSDKDGNILSKITYPSLSQDISYGYKDGKYVMFDVPTPGKINDSKELKQKKNKKYTIEINEYMTNNIRSHYDTHGNYYDFVEIYNYGDSDINLDDLYISDDEKELKKFKFPNKILNKKSYMIIYFSKEKVNYTDNIYVPFGLSSNDKYIIISDGVKIIDKVEIVPLCDNVSYGKVNGTFKYFTTPTPGAINNTEHFDKIGGNDGSS